MSSEEPRTGPSDPPAKRGTTKGTDHGRDLGDWIGHTRDARDRLTLERARKLAATLDLDVESLAEGDALPHGWHWIYFHELVPRSALGDDGHERRGDFLPPVPLDRRMWAGGTLRFLRPLRIGDEVSRISTVRSVEKKEGRSGPLVFVTVEHRIHDSEGVALEEEQELVYLSRTKEERGSEDSGGERDRIARTTESGDDGSDGRESDGPESSGAPEPSDAAAPDVRWRESVTADEVTLFRFSALTFNGHRIHYDRRYAVDVEGYPDLVVHGPLVALLLLGAGVRWASEAEDVALDPDEPLTFRYQARRPVFCGQTVELRGSPRRDVEEAGTEARRAGVGKALGLGIHAPDGGLVMQATLMAGHG